jgi:hypothetical protein
MILILSFYALLCIHLFIMLDFGLYKASTGVDPYFIDVWVSMHRDDPEATQKLVSNNFTFVQSRYTEELSKTHGPDTDLRSVPFDVTAVYHAGEGLRHGRYVESH